MLGMHGVSAAVARTRLGRRFLAGAVSDDVVLRWLVNTLSDQIAARSTFEGVAWSGSTFADEVGVLSSNLLNHGVSRLMLDEAAYLYRLVGTLTRPRVVEIGRYRGGTTLLLAAAGASVLSIDVDPKVAEMDKALIEVLERRGLRPSVSLVLGDSRTQPVTAASQDVVFVDGDHSYEGARADVEHWLPALAPGGHLVVNNAFRPEPGLPWADPWKVEGVWRLCRELLGEPRLELAGRAGTLAHFKLR